MISILCSRQGELHPDLDMAFSSVKACSFSVFIVTSVIGAGQAKQKFLEKNVHQKFETKFSYAVSIINILSEKNAIVFATAVN